MYKAVYLDADGVFPAGTMDDVLVSVVIPVYNTATYLAECLDSVLAQTHRNIEVIVVNDGSTDGSLEIMRDYERRDSRLRVIDKPNGGYGHSVNRGLSEARGEYLSIIEPDDLIDARMFEELLSVSGHGTSDAADIIKGSYWEYFAPQGSDPWVEMPNLMNCMPKEPMKFKLSEHWEVLYHHPSIWSALYRRDFIEKKGIRMIEPKGAGWADNPFFFETLLQADTLVWVPKPYYYYRQDNPNASSNLRDYHMPFDRLRDVRAIFDRLGVTNPDYLICLYNREFCYILRTVLDGFAFPEKDPELEGLIREVIESMDGKLVLGAKEGLSKEFKTYYRDVMGQYEQRVKSHDSVANPLVSIVLPVHNDREYLWPFLARLSGQKMDDFEVIAVDCGSTDRSLEILERCAAKDRRFSVISSKDPSFAAGINEAIGRVRGTYLYLTLPTLKYRADFLSKIKDALAFAPNADALVFDEFLRSFERLFPDKETKMLLFEDADQRALLALCSNVAAPFKVFRTEFVRKADVGFEDCDGRTGELFCMRLLERAPRVVLRRKFAMRHEPEDVRVDRVRELEAGVYNFDELNQMEEFVEAQEDAVLNQMFWMQLFDRLLLDVRFVSVLYEGEAYLKRLFDRFREAEERCGAALFTLPGQHMVYRLRFYADLSYGNLMRTMLKDQREAIEDLNDWVEDLEESLSYQLGNKVVRTAKRLMGKSGLEND